MTPSSRETASRAVFVVCLAVLAVVYGVAAGTFGWFPGPLLQRAWFQAMEAGAAGDAPHYAVPRVYERAGARVVEPGSVQPGLTLILGMWPDLDAEQGARLVDRDGRIVHHWSIEPTELFPEPPRARIRRLPADANVHGAHLYPDGDLIFNVSYVGTVRMDACGEVEWRLSGGSHHSVVPDEDGSLWVSGGSWEPSIGGFASFADSAGLSEPIYYDRVLHVSAEDGEILEEIDVLTVLYENGLQRALLKASEYGLDEEKTGDITHLNDVEPLPSTLAEEYPLFEAGDLMISLNHLDLVLVFDPDSGRVKWHAQQPFLQQHDPDFLGDGWIGVFDNNKDGSPRGTLLGGSRVLALQPHTDSTRVLFPGPRAEPFYTDVQGEWQSLDNGNLLLTESEAGRVVEVAPDGRTVWEWVVEPWDETRILELSDATRHDLTAEDVAAWRCSGGPP